MRLKIYPWRNNETSYNRIVMNYSKKSEKTFWFRNGDLSFGIWYLYMFYWQVELNRHETAQNAIIMSNIITYENTVLKILTYIIRKHIWVDQFSRYRIIYLIEVPHKILKNIFCVDWFSRPTQEVSKRGFFSTRKIIHVRSLFKESSEKVK